METLVQPIKNGSSCISILLPCYSVFHEVKTLFLRIQGQHGRCWAGKVLEEALAFNKINYLKRAYFSIFPMECCNKMCKVISSTMEH